MLFRRKRRVVCSHITSSKHTHMITRCASKISVELQSTQTQKKKKRNEGKSESSPKRIYLLKASCYRGKCLRWWRKKTYSGGNFEIHVQTTLKSLGNQYYRKAYVWIFFGPTSIRVRNMSLTTHNETYIMKLFSPILILEPNFCCGVTCICAPKASA